MFVSGVTHELDNAAHERGEDELSQEDHGTDNGHIRPDTPHETAMRCALVSIDSTMRSNATVGPPIELLYYEGDSLDGPARYCKFEENDPYLVELRRSWDDNICSSKTEAWIHC